MYHWHIRRRRGGGGPGRPAARLAIPAMAVAAIAMLVQSCGDGPVEPAPPPAPVATAVTVNPGSAALSAFGETARLTAEVRDQDGQVMAGAVVEWTTSNAAVATVLSSGLVTAAGNGQARITASAGAATGSAVVTVMQSAASVEVSPATAALTPLGATVQLAAAALDANGHAVAGAAYSWESSDAAVATVSSSGLVTAAGNGQARITASAGEATGSAVVTVMPSAAAVVVSPVAETVAVGDTLRLTAQASDANGHAIADAELVWESSDPAVATVDGSGLVTGVAEGAATVTASSGDAYGTARITVENPDRAALVALYNATDGPNWINNNNWLTDAPLGRWNGVETDASGRVVQIMLSGGWWDNEANEWVRYGLRGQIPPEIGDLTHLTDLVLRYNLLSGPIPPEIGDLTRLTNLDLHQNLLSGPIPPEVGDLTRLTNLDLDQNLLSGPIPPEIGELASMTNLELSDNNLSGPIPPEIGNLASLEYLLLNRNSLSGGIPPEFGNLGNLQILGLFRNQLTGSIPVELGRMASLTHLMLSFNDLAGPLPAELADLRSLTAFDLTGNNLTGPIGDGFLALDELEIFEFGRNVDLCARGTAAFVAWLDRIDIVSGPYCNESDMKVLERLYETSGGPNWRNSDGWLQSPALDEWNGVTADDLGRVVTLDLTRNRLTGDLQAGLANLAEMTTLRLGGNGLSGRLPRSLTRLALVELRYAETGLCVPADPTFQIWLSGIASHDGTGVACGPLSDREILEILYAATDGPGWWQSDNWLTDAPLGDWHGVVTDASGRVVTLWLYANRLSGSIPPELGNLTSLEGLALNYSDLSGPIPPELGNLARLETLWLAGNVLSGGIPPELGNLSDLGGLLLSDNDLSGPIPPELGSLTSLRQLWLSDNDLSGPIPPEFGNLASLWQLWLSDNDLAGPLPQELGRLSRLRELDLARNAFTGAVPPEFGALAALERLTVAGNAGLSGVLPASLTDLRRLQTFVAAGTGLCASPEGGFLDWLLGVPVSHVQVCSQQGGSAAYLSQAVQSHDVPVPLVADEEALLRVFVTAPSATGASLPPVRATFYVNGAETHVVDIPGRSSPIPLEFDEGDLSRSLNAPVPAGIVQPGLEMVIEIDPDATLDPGLGVTQRIPTTGRQAIEVRAMPQLDLTLVPFLWAESPDSAVIHTVQRAARDPDGDELLGDIRTLLPVGDLSVTAHAPVHIDTNSAFDLAAATQAIRAMEGGSGHYMGTMSGAVTDAAGVASQPGRSGFSIPVSSTMAHELGHNFSLGHAPCRAQVGLDHYYPYGDGRIRAWGYDLAGGGHLVPPSTPDLMSYCSPQWISGYNFKKAFLYRLTDEGPGAVAVAAAPKSLLLWGGLDSAGTLNLEPAFVVDAPAARPDSTGPYRITGQSASGDEFFALGFAMPEVADGNGHSSFAFALPVQEAWAGALARITLSGPGGTVSLDEDTDTPMTILLDPGTRQVRGILRDLPSPAAAARAPQADAETLDVLFSRGIPDAAAWSR